MAGAVRTVIALAVCLGFGPAARAQAVTVVALGNSQTAGTNLPAAEAYPAKLEQILRGEGLDVQVINAGIGGDTTVGMLSRLDSDVPAGTRIVVLQPGANDAQRRPARMVPDGLPTEQTVANVEAIVDRLRQRGIKVLVWQFREGHGADVARHSGATFIGQPLAGLVKNPGYMQPDGFHLTPEGYSIVAERVAPYVARAIRQP